MDRKLALVTGASAGIGAAFARGFNRGELYTEAGKLVASVTQEGLMRPRDPKFKN